MKNVKLFLIASLLVSSYALESCKDDNQDGGDPVPAEVKVETIEYATFSEEHIAFGSGLKQTVDKVFSLHPKAENIDTIKMFVILDCPSGGCNAWDVYANIKVKDQNSGKWYEIGRYITPYGIDNSAVEKGFEIDVTDFKSLLHGDVELRARIETWGADGWNLTVNFEVTTGIPDYQYYAISDVIMYDAWSTSGVPYGKGHSLNLDKTIQIPANSEETTFRTIISGWGHATPVDADGRPCAEWCFRTHHIMLDNSIAFDHQMGPLGCDVNPVKNQKGNWMPDRAGWCPGMAVPVRRNTLASPRAGETLAYEYDYEDWTSDGGTVSGNEGAYYATSSFVVVKSNTPIQPAVVTD
jgi:hypothetical protein